MGYCLCCHSHVAPLLGDCSSLFYAVLINTMTKSHGGKKGFEPLLRASSSLREAQAETVEELCVLPCSVCVSSCVMALPHHLVLRNTNLQTPSQAALLETSPP